MEYIDAHVHVWTDDFDRYPIYPPHEKSDMNPKTFYPLRVVMGTFKLTRCILLSIGT